MITTRRAILSLAVALGAAAAAPVAHAESHAWSAAKKTLPANLQVIAGVSFDAIRSSQLFQQLWPLAMQQQGAQAKLDAFKTTCGFDPLSVFDSIAVGIDDAQKGAIVVSLKGTDEKAIEACLTKVAKADGKTPSITKAGSLTKYGGMGDKDVYVKWIAKDTFAIATDPMDKDLLTKYTAGGVGADKSFKAALSAVKTDAAVWGITNKTQDLSDINAKMLVGYGQADVNSGSIAAEVHIVVDSAKAAADAATKANTQLAQAKAQASGVPPALMGVLNTLQVKSSGSEIVVSAQMAEKDLLGLIMTFAGGGGGASAPRAPSTPSPLAPPKPH